MHRFGTDRRIISSNLSEYANVGDASREVIMISHYKSKIVALVMALMLTMSAVPAQATWLFGGSNGGEPKAQATEESATLRVKLTSLGEPVALGMTLAGNYTVDGDKGFRFERDSEISVAVDGENLLLSCGGLVIDMGVSVRFKRHQVAEGEQNGLYIHENKHNTLYAGDLVLNVEKGIIEPVLYIDVDEYLYGVVPYEMSDSFPIEALKAQAVAARTYALSRRDANGHRSYDVVDTVADQVFRGYNADYQNAVIAVNETRYVAGRYKDKYATCYFGASNGGQTAMPEQLWGYSGDYGYLDVRDDPYDLENSKSIVKRLNTGVVDGEIEPSLRTRIKQGLSAQNLGELASVRILDIVPIEPKFGEGNRMFTKLRFMLQLTGNETNEAGEVTQVVLEGEHHVDMDFYNDLKPNLGLKINAANCEVLSVVKHPVSDSDQTAASFGIESRRFGHGVGMSQRGAQQMASGHNMTWTEILNFYYPKMDLCKMEFRVEPLTQIDALPASLGYARVKPTPKPTPAPLPALQDGEYYAVVKVETTQGTLNVREQPGTEYKIRGLLNTKQRLIVVKEMGNGWAEIKTAELTGYVSMDYLVRE